MVQCPLTKYVLSREKIKVYFVCDILLTKLCKLAFKMSFRKSVVLISYFILLVPNPTHALVTKWSADVLFSVYSSCSAIFAITIVRNTSTYNLL